MKTHNNGNGNHRTILVDSPFARLFEELGIQAEGAPEVPVSAPAPPPPARPVNAGQALLQALAEARATVARGQQLAAQRAGLLAEVRSLEEQVDVLNREAKANVGPIEAALAEARSAFIDLIPGELIEAARVEALALFEEYRRKAEPLTSRSAGLRAEAASLEADPAYQAHARRAEAESQARAAAARTRIARALALGKEKRYRDAEHILQPLAADVGLPGDVRQEAAGYLAECRDLARRDEAEAHVKALNRARAALTRGIRALRTGRFGEAETALAPVAGAPELPAEVCRQARGLLWQAWLSESEQLAQPGDVRYTRPGGLFLLRHSAVAATWGKTGYQAGMRVSTLPRDARPKPWPRKVEERLQPASTPMLSEAEVVSAAVQAVAEVAARDCAADLEAAVVRPAPAPEAAPQLVAGLHPLLADRLAALQAVGYQVAAWENSEAETTLVVIAPDSRELTVSARARRKLAEEQARVRGEKLVRDLSAAGFVAEAASTVIQTGQEN